MRIFEPILNAQFLTFFCVKKFFQKDDISKNYLTGIFLTILNTVTSTEPKQSNTNS